MKQTIMGQTVASTHMDDHGEQLSVEDLGEILASMPLRMPLHQNHDLSKPVCGEMTDCRIVQDPDDSTHFRIVCDVTFDDELIENLNGPGGFSFSALVNPVASESADCIVYLPFPLYNDQPFVDALLKSDPSIGVGKWLKKGMDPAIVVLLYFLAKPLWDTIYKEFFEGPVKRICSCLKGLWPANTAVNCLSEVPIPTTLYEPRPQVVLIPCEPDGPDFLAAVPDALNEAKKFCEADFWLFGKRIRRMRMTVDRASGKCVVLGVDYIDGTHRSFS